MMLSMVFVMVIMSVASAQRIAEVINQKSSLTSPENGLKEVKNGDIVLIMSILIMERVNMMMDPLFWMMFLYMSQVVPRLEF